MPNDTAAHSETTSFHAQHMTSPGEHEQDSHGGHGVGHVVPYKYLVATGAALLVLTFITVWVAQFDFGTANIWVALAVATVKATLVALFFMHLRWDRPFNAFVLVGSIAFVALFIAGSMGDVAENRPWREQYREIELQNGESKEPARLLAEIETAPTPLSHEEAEVPAETGPTGRAEPEAGH